MYSVKLLPNYYKKVGWSILLTTIAVPFLSLILPDLWEQKQTIKPFLVSGMLVGLLIIALARDKVEDELIMELRLKALAGAFIIGCAYVIFNPFIDLLFGDAVSNGSIGSIFFTMSLWYHLNFYLLKRSR
ncbi:MAG: hypothetical protein JWP69_2281 [Flaviaesturariibacter sp.]|nr:hypothetical protein [Flaviaesturariibacter sp.]